MASLCLGLVLSTVVCLPVIRDSASPAGPPFPAGGAWADGRGLGGRASRLRPEDSDSDSKAAVVAGPPPAAEPSPVSESALSESPLVVKLLGSYR